MSDSAGTSVFVHIVSYNHAKYLKPALDGLLSQKGFVAGSNLIIRVTDNNSTDNFQEVSNELSGKNIIFTENKSNFGFATAHNIAITDFLKSGAEYFLCHNPDLKLAPDAILKMTEAISFDKEAGTVCPKLLRADEELRPLRPNIIDAAGIYFTSSLRHFDRGGEAEDRKQYDRKEYVIGGSGACLLMKKEYITDIAIDQKEFRNAVNSVYPQLSGAPEERIEVFDEAFFAYREDADLAWRSQLYGWKCLYVPEAVGFHVRKVTPEKRDMLSKDINLLGVKNRFLLQLNNYSLSCGIKSLILGYFIRNFIVIAGVILKERSSFPAFFQFFKLFNRNIRRRAIIMKKSKVSNFKVAEWFDKK